MNLYLIGLALAIGAVAAASLVYIALLLQDIRDANDLRQGIFQEVDGLRDKSALLKERGDLAMVELSRAASLLTDIVYGMIPPEDREAWLAEVKKNLEYWAEIPSGNGSKAS